MTTESDYPWLLAAWVYGGKATQVVGITYAMLQHQMICHEGRPLFLGVDHDCPALLTDNYHDTDSDVTAAINSRGKRTAYTSTPRGRFLPKRKVSPILLCLVDREQPE